MTGSGALQRVAHGLHAIERWWFRSSSRYQMGVFRVLLVSWVGWFYSERLFPRLSGARERAIEFHDPPSLAQWLRLPLPLPEHAIEPVRQLAMLLVALALVGLLARVALIALAFLNLGLGLAVNAWGYTAHASALPALVLFIVAFAPGATALSLDALLIKLVAQRKGRPPPGWAPELLPHSPKSVWPVRTLLVLLCLLYFSAGVSKLRYAGGDWADGQTLAFYLGGGSKRGEGTQRFIQQRGDRPDQAFRDGFGIVDYAYVGRPTAIGSWLSQQPVLLRLIASAALLGELLFPLALLGRWPRRLALLFGLLFHAGIALTLSINFTAYIICYTMFVDWCGLVRRLRTRPTAKPQSPLALGSAGSTPRV